MAFYYRKHIEIFGFYYPRIFTDWFADNWITEVYLPNRTVKLRQVKVLQFALSTRNKKVHVNCGDFLNARWSHSEVRLLTKPDRNSE